MTGALTQCLSLRGRSTFQLGTRAHFYHRLEGLQLAIVVRQLVSLLLNSSRKSLSHRLGAELSADIGSLFLIVAEAILRLGSTNFAKKSRPYEVYASESISYSSAF